MPSVRTPTNLRTMIGLFALVVLTGIPLFIGLRDPETLWSIRLFMIPVTLLFVAGMFVVAAVLLVCFAMKPSPRSGLAGLLWATLGGTAASLIAACLDWPRQGELILTSLAETCLRRCGAKVLSAKVLRCESLKVPSLESAKFGKCQGWKVRRCESVTV
jgi:hypothetical protein